uniref:uncharacterized protein LOC120891345 n=1 Tax=Ictidomys tridecemlineatus TaxID=43179 RepID=UPI001A9E931D|nr:uncharacterized protein LOC120891345 [Ictidomys tridecemlineatus]
MRTISAQTYNPQSTHVSDADCHPAPDLGLNPGVGLGSRACIIHYFPAWPPGLYRASLDQILRHLGKGSSRVPGATPGALPCSLWWEELASMGLTCGFPACTGSPGAGPGLVELPPELAANCRGQLSGASAQACAQELRCSLTTGRSWTGHAPRCGLCEGGSHRSPGAPGTVNAVEIVKEVLIFGRAEHVTVTNHTAPTKPRISRSLQVWSPSSHGKKTQGPSSAIEHVLSMREALGGSSAQGEKI